MSSRLSKLLGFKRQSKDTHVAIAISPDRTGLILKVDSNVLKGRGTVLRMKLNRESESNIKIKLMFGAAKLAERQNQLWKDNHDLSQVALKAAEVWREILLDNKLSAELGTMIPFAPHSPGFDADQAQRVSRASEVDPLTKDMAKGRTKEWGVDG